MQDFIITVLLLIIAVCVFITVVQLSQQDKQPKIQIQDAGYYNILSVYSTVPL